jgi:hypothetical protein
VRVLEVVIEPGSREPEHTHRNRRVMIVDAPARIRYDEHGDLTFESPPGAGPEPPRVIWMDPEGPHNVENIDATSYHAFPRRDPGLTKPPGHRTSTGSV